VPQMPRMWMCMRRWAPRGRHPD